MTPDLPRLVAWYLALPDARKGGCAVAIGAAMKGLENVSPAARKESEAVLGRLEVVRLSEQRASAGSEGA